MKKLLIVGAEHNDGDTIYAITYIDDDDLARFRPLMEAIAAFQPYTSKWTYNRAIGNGQFKLEEHETVHTKNWCTGDALDEGQGEKSPPELYVNGTTITDELVNEFEMDCVPYAEYGKHQIVEMRVLQVTGEEFKYDKHSSRVS